MPHARKATAAYVYLIHDQSEYKIGFSRNPHARLPQVARRGATLVHAFLSANPRQVEKALHRRFSDSHVGGEWFRLSDDDVALVCTLTRTDSADDLPEALWTPESPADRHADPRFAFHLEQELLDALDYYLTRLPHNPGRSQVVRDALRDFLRSKGCFTPPDDASSS